VPFCIPQSHFSPLQQSLHSAQQPHLAHKSASKPVDVLDVASPASLVAVGSPQPMTITAIAKNINPKTVFILSLPKKQTETANRTSETITVVMA
jgi:hypothetical protein